MTVVGNYGGLQDLSSEDRQRILAEWHAIPERLKRNPSEGALKSFLIDYWQERAKAAEERERRLLETISELQGNV